MKRLLILLALLLPLRAGAQTTLEMTPTMSSLTTLGQTVVVEVRILDYTNLRGFSIPILYNENVFRHVSLSATGDLFGGSQICLTSGSNAAQGRILVDCAVSSAEVVSGSNGLAFRVTFEAFGNGAADAFFDDETVYSSGSGGEVMLRDQANAPIAYQVGNEAVIAVVSEEPLETYTELHPSGSADASYRSANPTRARVRVLNAASGGKTTLNLYEQAPPGGSDAPFVDPDGSVNDLQVADRYWEYVSALTGTYQTYLAFSYQDIAGVVNPAQLRVAYRPVGSDATAAWTLIPASQTVVNEGTQEVRIEGAAVNSQTYGSGQYTIVSDAANNPLPVELSSFEAYLDQQSALLTWVTASETNNAGFEVLHAPAAGPQSTWNRLAFIAGQGTTTEQQHYQYRAENLAPGYHRFRLAQIDFNGDRTLSPIVEVWVEVADQFVISAPAPNPTTSEAELTLIVRVPQKVTVDVLDVLGRQIARLQDGPLSANDTHRFRFEGDDLSPGIYFMRITGERFQDTRRVVLHH